MATRNDHLQTLRETAFQLWRTLKAGHPLQKEGLVLTRIQQETIFMLKHQGTKGVAIKDIADHFEISGSAATQLVDGMEEKGLVVRESDPDDRRITRVRFSESAAQNFRAMKHEYDCYLEDLVTDLTDEEVERLTVVLQKVCARAASHDPHNRSL